MTGVTQNLHIWNIFYFTEIYVSMGFFFYIHCVKFPPELSPTYLCSVSFVVFKGPSYAAAARPRVSPLMDAYRLCAIHLLQYINDDLFVPQENASPAVHLKPLVLGRCNCNLKLVIFRLIKRREILSIFCEIVLSWMLQDLCYKMFSKHWFR